VDRAVGALRRNHIVCGVRNGRIRVSLAPYNNSADVDALIDSMATL
jgi:selenocysteine lyase/cysteine desulfurase